MTVTLDHILEAEKRIRPTLPVTPCLESQGLSELAGCQIYCKLDNLQRTGSFKERGACNALELLSPEQQERGVVAASAGNHALALAVHGRRLSIPVHVVMPRFAPLIKQQRCRNLGANVKLFGDSFQEARQEAMRIRDELGLTYIHGYDDPAIIAGQGTIALEILQQVPDVNAIVVPIGGAGLLAGIVVAVKSLRPEIEIVGIEAVNAACFSAALSAGKPIDIKMRPTLADGLAVGKVGELAFALSRNHVDRHVQVEESAIALSVTRLMEIEKTVAEGAAAATLSPFLLHQIPELYGKKVVLCIGGGNIDLSIINRLIETALVQDGRLVRFTATISDRPGGLAHLAKVIASTGAGIKEVAHERTFARLEIGAVNVICTVETRDRLHIDELFSALAAHGIPSKV
ncbi:threonine ammonia-lyase [Planctomicrobium sp. SH527]|uniref:threonine ammonia-lyase n=1 Tax=Planctomicrobium sp. SH527 TaxID=3448123 RepID=UPI003F5C96C3